MRCANAAGTPFAEDYAVVVPTQSPAWLRIAVAELISLSLAHGVVKMSTISVQHCVEIEQRECRLRRCTQAREGSVSTRQQEPWAPLCCGEGTRTGCTSSMAIGPKCDIGSEQG
jgi:hypothetical protein